MAEGGNRKSDAGWVLIHRSILDNWVWRDRPFSKGQAWIDLILLAKHRDEKFLDKRGKLIDGKRGCVYLSESALAERWGWSRKKVDNFLFQLEREKEIETVKKSTTEGTTIFIVNYDKFQASRTGQRTAKAQQRNNRGTTEEHIQRINKECIKNKKEKAAPLSSEDGAAASDDGDDDVVDLGAMTDEEFEEYLKETHKNGTV